MKVRRFFESVYRDNALRQARKRAFWSDLARYAGNTALRPVEELLIERYRRADLPLVFIVAVPRTGTTLSYQLVARPLDIGYVNNFMARFWMAPIVGGAIYRELHSDAPADIPLRSQLGATEGPGSPHEFSWFWEYWTEFGDVDDHPEEDLAEMNWEAIRRELEGLAGWFDAPVVMKSINYVNYHIEWIARHVPSARFVWIRRSKPYVAQSIYQSREERYGDPSVWWSVRPADVEDWLDRPPAEQIAHQIEDISAAIRAGFDAIDERRQHTLHYEELTTEPAESLRALADFAETTLVGRRELEDLGLEPRNRQRLPDDTFQKLSEALRP
jgi:hypothetical protein